MKRSEILKAADKCVSKTRDAQYGGAEEVFGKIAAYWSTHLGVEVGAQDVGIMMVLLKMARVRDGVVHPDNFIDACGYAALTGELQSS